MEKYLSMDVQILIWLSKLGSISYAYAKKKASSTNVEKEQKRNIGKKSIHDFLTNECDKFSDIANCTHHSAHMSMKYFHLGITLRSTTTIFLFHIKELKFHQRFQA